MKRSADLQKAGFSSGLCNTSGLKGRHHEVLGQCQANRQARSTHSTPFPIVVVAAVGYNWQQVLHHNSGTKKAL